MTMYQKFKKLNIDHAALELKACGNEEAYFCTPKGARIIGTAGVDGIHYCFVRGQGETVFAVNPSNLPGRNVYPIARSFEDLLRLLVACGSMAALEQAHQWDEEQFAEYIAENPPSEEVFAIFEVLGEKLGISPMEEPFSYVRNLQKGFYGGDLSFPEEYYELRRAARPELPSEWFVTLEDGFHPRRGKHGREIPVGKAFSWGDELWQVPAVYLFSGGLVVDFCICLNGERVKAFYEKYRHIEEQGISLTEGEELQIRRENPTNIDFRTHLTMNGEDLRGAHSHHQYWIPAEIVGHKELESKNARWVLEHYGFDLSSPWVLCRSAYIWEGRRNPKLRSLELRLERKESDFLGQAFTAPKMGESVVLVHPMTQKEYTLTVREYEVQELPDRFHDDTMEFPRHLAAMTYTIYPQIPPRAFQLKDCDSGDNPRPKNPDERGRIAMSVGAVAVIRTSNDPSKTYRVNGEEVKPQGVCSSLHFAPLTEPVRWQSVFREKCMDDLTVILL